MVAQASAASVEVIDGMAVFTAAVGERNEVRAGDARVGFDAPQPSLKVVDAGAPLIAGNGCEQLDTNSVFCAEPGSAMPLIVRAGDGADRVASHNVLALRRVTLYGGGGGDVLTAGDHHGGIVEMDGGPGDDTLTTNLNSLGLPVLRGGAGDDLLLMSGAAGGAAYGGDGDDRIRFCCYGGTSFPLRIEGGRGDDSYTFPAGVIARAMVPGPGFDTLDHGVLGMFGQVMFDFAACAACVERVVGSTANDAIVGDERDQEIIGRDGNDSLVGGGGSDTLSGDGGDDTIDSHEGVADAVHCGAGEDSVTADVLDVVDDDCKGVNRS